MDKYIILSVEDSDSDFDLIEFALAQCTDTLSLCRATDGEAAIKLLKDSIDSPVRLPDLILLDVNMPRRDGFEVLRFISEQQLDSKIPVIMFSSSANYSEKKQAIELGAREFITKASDLECLINTILEICNKHLLDNERGAPISAPSNEQPNCS